MAAIDDRTLLGLARIVAPDDPATAAAIAVAESGARPDAVGDGGCSIGLWQINWCANGKTLQTEGIPSKEALFDPSTNARAAHIILVRQGWRAWTVYRTGRYRLYLSRFEGAGAGGDTVALTNTSTQPAGLNPLEPLGEAVGILRKLADPALWRRIGQGVLGAAMVIIGLLMVFAPSLLGRASKVVIEAVGPTGKTKAVSKATSKLAKAAA